MKQKSPDLTGFCFFVCTSEYESYVAVQDWVLLRIDAEMARPFRVRVYRYIASSLCL
jgi:hypothetical protein